jgi:hypothetical protein
MSGAPCLDMRAVCKRIILRLIEAERDDPGEMRARIAIAYHDGWLTDDERRVFETLTELEAAQ